MKKLIAAVLVLLMFLCSCGKKEASSNLSSGIPKVESNSSVHIESETVSSETDVSIEHSSSTNKESSRVNTPSKVETSSKASSATTSIKPISSVPSVLNKDPSGIGIMFTPAKNKTPLIAVHPENYYALSQLKKTGTEAEIKAYRLFAEKIGNYESVIDFDFKISEKEVINAYHHYTFDYPQHFWRGFQAKTQSVNSNVVKVIVEGSMCGGNKQQIKELDDKYKAKIKSILSNLSGNNTSIEKELFIHNYIVNNCTYIEGTNAHNSYGVIIEGKGVCESYAKAFVVLMREAGVQCLLVDGKLTKDLGLGDDHQWNMVEIDGEYYHVDVTADDPSLGVGIEALKFDYFNITETQLKKDHKIEHNYYEIPKATSNKHNFFDFFKLKFSSLNVENLAKSLAFSVLNNLEYSHGSFDNLSNDAAGDFLVENYYDILDEANRYLKDKKIKVDGEINYIVSDSVLSMKISY